MKTGIAFFDFDGTITTRDTLLEFIRFARGSFRFYLGFLVNAPYLLAMKLGLMSNQRAKEKVLSFFFGGHSVAEFEKYCAEFSRNALPALIRPKAIAEIRDLQQRGFTVVVVTASPDNWISHWAKANGLELIASCLEVVNGKITGRLNGKNCHGQEKVSRIKELYQIEDYGVVHAYGDSSGDLPMLDLATKKHYKPFL